MDILLEQCVDRWMDGLKQKKIDGLLVDYLADGLNKEICHSNNIFSILQNKYFIFQVYNTNSKQLYSSLHTSTLTCGIADL